MMSVLFRDGACRSGLALVFIILLYPMTSPAQSERLLYEGAARVEVDGKLYRLTLEWQTATQGFEIVSIREM